MCAPVHAGDQGEQRGTYTARVHVRVCVCVCEPACLCFCVRAAASASQRPRLLAPCGKKTNSLSPPTTLQMKSVLWGGGLIS